jgi:two-component system sensor histidine kinase KdpD
VALQGKAQRAIDYLAAAGVVAAATLLGGLSHWWELSDAVTATPFVAGVALVAVHLGRGPCIAAIGLSILSFDYFYVAPTFAFAFINLQSFVALCLMVGMGLLISELTDRLRAELSTSRLKERRTDQLYRMTRDFGAGLGTQHLVATAGRYVQEIFGGEAVIYLRDDAGNLELRFGHENPLARDSRTLPAARETAQQGSSQNESVTTAIDHAALAPLAGSERTIGVLGVRLAAPREFDSDERRLLTTCANLIGLSLERYASMLRTQAARTQVEAEQLRNSLLTSISHDLRTPLATIAITTSSLLEGPADQRLAEKRDVLEAIVDETRQLSRQVDNLLDMGRINSGNLQLDRQWQVLDELVGVALERMRRELSRYAVAIDLPADFPLIFVAEDLIVQVLINLLENAVRYTPQGSRISIRARRREGRAEITIADDGPGLPAGSEAKVFEKFYRGTTKIADGRRGLGLGLAICRSIMRAHGGDVTACNGAEGGAEFTAWLPSPQESPQVSLDGAAASAQG